MPVSCAVDAGGCCACTLGPSVICDGAVVARAAGWVACGFGGVALRAVGAEVVEPGSGEVVLPLTMPTTSISSVAAPKRASRRRPSRSCDGPGTLPADGRAGALVKR